jgi:hypothetical protein
MNSCCGQPRVVSSLAGARLNAGDSTVTRPRPPHGIKVSIYEVIKIVWVTYAVAKSRQGAVAVAVRSGWSESAI